MPIRIQPRYIDFLFIVFVKIISKFHPDLEYHESKMLVFYSVHQKFKILEKKK
jgi:hypothetical protein